mmetsp:Transcript_2280/g.5941  ORF Transcript_2280/g.5941 Transcript_2280/m.5941 type:complete len:249 (+) Transcript_2280:325-1071(+)
MRYLLRHIWSSYPIHVRGGLAFVAALQAFVSKPKGLHDLKKERHRAPSPWSARNLGLISRNDSNSFRSLTSALLRPTMAPASPQTLDVGLCSPGLPASTRPSSERTSIPAATPSSRCLYPSLQWAASGGQHLVSVPTTMSASRFSNLRTISSAPHVNMLSSESARITIGSAPSSPAGIRMSDALSPICLSSCECHHVPTPETDAARPCLCTDAMKSFDLSLSVVCVATTRSFDCIFQRGALNSTGISV